MQIINEKEFDAFIKSKKVVLIDFFATWCGPCRMLSPILEEVLEESKGEFDIAKVDVDESYNLAKKFGVLSVPTMIVFQDGVEADKLIGYRQKEDILDTLRTYL